MLYDGLADNCELAQAPQFSDRSLVARHISKVAQVRKDMLTGNVLGSEET